MKILQVLPEMNAGGVERGTMELARHLVAQGHESLVLSGGGRLVETLVEEGSRHITMPVGRKSPVTLRLTSRVRAVLEREQPDILHLRSRVPAWLCWLAWRKLPEGRRPRLVTTVHGFYSVSRWSAIMTRGERVICVSESIRQYVQENYPAVPAGRLRVIPRGIDPAQYPYGYQPSAWWLAQFYSEFPGARGRRLLTLPGRITRLKGHADLAQIMRQLRDLEGVHAIVAGGAHPRKQAYFRELQALFRREGLTEKVSFTGNRSDMREILAASEIVLSLTAKPESFGRTTLEALAMGVPVVGYARGGVGEQLDVLFPAGRVPPGDVAAAAAKLRDFVTHAIPAVERANPFTLQRMLDSTLDVYRELLASPLI